MWLEVAKMIIQALALFVILSLSACAWEFHGSVDRISQDGAVLKTANQVSHAVPNRKGSVLDDGQIGMLEK